MIFASLNSFSWDMVLQEEGITIFAKTEAPGVMPFKADGVVNANIDKIVAVIQDYQNKHLWSPKLKRVELHEALDDQTFIFSEFYKTPWPAVDREFLLKGKIFKVSENRVNIMANSIVDTELHNDDYIQAEVKALNITLEKIDQNKTKMTFEFYGDMKGWMPNWLMNLIQKKWPFRFIQSLRKRIVEVDRIQSEL
jgi:hypothetical protein